jgi:hypothetical protein
VSQDEIAAEKLTLRQAEAAFDEEVTSGEVYESCVHKAACARLCKMYAEVNADDWLGCIVCDEYEES